MKAIETVYNGYRFRSRLEARWVVFFDALKYKFLYEVEGFEFPDGLRYLPDFYLPEIGTWAEVKPATLSDEEMAKARALVIGSKRPLLVLSGLPDFKPYDYLCPAEMDGPDETILTDAVLCDHWYHGKGHLYVCTGGGWDDEGEFSDAYRDAVHQARSYRFGERS